MAKRTIYQSKYGVSIYGTDRYGELIIDTTEPMIHRKEIENNFVKTLINKFYKSSIERTFQKVLNSQFYKRLTNVFYRKLEH